MIISESVIAKLKVALRVKNDSAEEEITDLASACIHDLDIAGAHVQTIDDPLTYQAVKLYCKWHFGYDEDVERFKTAYVNLRDSMALSGDYAEGAGTDDDVMHLCVR